MERNPKIGNVLTRDRLALPLLEQNLERLNKAGLWNPARGLAGNVNAIGIRPKTRYKRHTEKTKTI